MTQKSAIITGVEGGIGQKLSKTFKHSGYNVIGLDIRPQKHSVCDMYYEFDLNKFVVDYKYRSRMNDLFEKNISHLDVLINNAAVQHLGNLKDITLKDWQESLNVNLTGPLLLSQLFLSQLEVVQGSIINIGSIHQQLTKPRFISYATTKSALIGLTKTMAVDLEGRVRVNAISPAAIETKMLLDGFDGDQSALDKLRRIHPVQRIGYPDDVAKLALFLSESNNGFIHGANITLDGGISSVLHDL